MQLSLKRGILNSYIWSLASTAEQAAPLQSLEADWPRKERGMKEEKKEGREREKSCKDDQNRFSHCRNRFKMLSNRVKS